MLLQFGGVPGGPELIILFIIFLFMLVIPVGVGLGLFLLGRWSANRGGDDEIERLQQRIEELETSLAAAREEPGGEESTTSADGGDDERQGS